MSKMVMVQKIRHSPTLNTVMMVEDAIRKSRNSVITIAEIKRKLPRQVNHATLIVILQYLEDSRKIAVSLRGITWIHSTNPNLRRAIANGMEI